MITFKQFSGFIPAGKGSDFRMMVYSLGYNLGTDAKRL